MKRGRALAAALLLEAAACGSTAPAPGVVEVDLGGAPDDPRSLGEASGLPEVRVVRLTKNASLGELLRDALEEATARGARLMVMTNGAQCRACRLFLHALDAPSMRAALGDVVLVRVDVSRYGEELAELGLASYVLPGLFLIDARGHARDAITGAEWTDDVAENIAPVVDAFAHERYGDRRAPEHRPP